MPWNFNAVCPKGHHAEQNGYDRDSLVRRLNANGAVLLYCPTCDRQWDATDVQRSMIKWALGIPAN